MRAIRAGLAQGSGSAYGHRALTAVTVAMLRDLPGRPNGQLVRRALRHWAFVVPGPGRQQVPTEDRLVLQWVAKESRPLVDLHDPVLARDVLESMRRKLDGGEAAVETMRRKRKVLVHALRYAMERGELGSHPLEKIRWRVPKPSVSVGPRVVANPHQARDLLNAVSYVGGYRRLVAVGWSGSSPACITRGCGRRRLSR